LKCNENIIDIVFTPCLHEYYCSICVDKIDTKNEIVLCPICGKKIKVFAKVFNK